MTTTWNRAAIMTMRREHYRYELWEDYQAGMYRPTCPGDELALQAQSAGLLSEPADFERIGREMVAAWPIAARQALTHVASNRRAWVGQAACCYAHGAPDYITKRAWWELAPDVQDAANETADQVIRWWEVTAHAQTLFAV